MENISHDPSASKSHSDIETLLEIILSLNSSLNRHLVLETLLDNTNKLFSCDASIILLLKEGLLQITNLRNYQPNKIIDGTDFQSLKISEINEFEQMLITHEPDIRPDVVGDSKWASIMRLKGIRAWAGTPIMSREQVDGFFLVFSTQPSSFSKVHIPLLKSLAQHTSLAIQNAQLYEEMLQEKVALKQLATLGTATAALQHRINNSFNIIIPNVHRLRKRINQDDPVIEEILEIIERNARYTSSLVARIQEPLREVENTSIDVNNLLSELMQRALEELRKKENAPEIAVTAYLDDSLPNINAPLGQLSEVFRNLIENAFRAMDNGGKLSVSTRYVNNNIEVKIKDTGKGIPPLIKERLFLRPVPSKEQGAGSGFGLWLSNLILSSLGGSIGIEKTDERGTTMIVTLPI